MFKGDLVNLVDVTHFHKVKNFCEFLFDFSACQAPSVKGPTLKEKDLLSRGASSYLLEKTPFQKGAKAISTELAPLNVHRLLLNVFYLRSIY